MAVQVRIFSTLADIDAAAWNACFPGELENYEYLLAVEQAGLPDFTWRYAVVREGEKILLAAPAFLADYHLDTTLDDGGLRRALRAIKKIFPGFLRVKLASLCSPLTEYGKVGFHPDVTAAEKPALIKELLTAFESVTRGEGYCLMGVKDIPVGDMPAWQLARTDLGYTGLPGMPAGYLDIKFTTEDGYFKSISRGARKDVRRKLRMQDKIRTEICTDISGIQDKIYQLYLQTRARSEFQFETLTPEYFAGILAHMPQSAFFMLYHLGDELIGANLLLQNKTTLLDKFFCMADSGPEHNLYFISWIENIRYALRHGQTVYNSGQASADIKRHLGSQMRETQMLFRHISPFWNQILKLAAPMFAMGE